MMDYCILTLPFSRGLSQIDAASILARAVRAADPNCKTENIIQYPVLDGGAGSLELLVTTRLGAFLEVEAKNFLGQEIVVPLGFVGDDQSIAIIRMGSLRDEAAGFEKCATTYGVGELIRDALDEGAFSAILCQDEPLGADAGLGLAAALGVKFYDAQNAELDLSKPIPDLFDRIARIDARDRPFELLSARVYLARTRATVLNPSSPELKAQLTRLSKIAEAGGGASRPIAEAFSTSMIEFGAAIFLPSENKEGSTLLLEASMIQPKIEGSKTITYVVASRDASQILDDAPEALTLLFDLAKSKLASVLLITENRASEDEIAALTLAMPPDSKVISLSEAPLFTAPIAASAADETLRRDQQMRLEKLVPLMLKKVLDSARVA